MPDALQIIAALRAQEPVAWSYAASFFWSSLAAVPGVMRPHAAPLYTRDPAALDALQAEVERLTRELAEARADAERWARLRKLIVSGPLVIAKVDAFGLTSWSGDDPDAAIDAAKEQSDGL